VIFPAQIDSIAIIVIDLITD